MKKKETNRPTKVAQKKPKKKKGPLYVSYGRKEWEVLSQIDVRALRLYLELKWLGDFHTGVVGMFEDQVLTYEGLARMVSIPVRQGMSASHATVDGTEIRRLLERLEFAGLVADRVYDGTRLTMTLPMSPIKTRQAETEPATLTTQPSSGSAQGVNPKTATPQQEPVSEGFCDNCEDADTTSAKLPNQAEKLPIEAGKLPASECRKSTASPHEYRGFSVSSLPLSVLNFNTYQYLSVPGSVQKGGEAVASPSTGGACDTHAPPPPPQGRQLLEGVGAAEGTMGELEIELMLKEFDNPPVLYMQTKETRQLIRNMEAMRVEGWEIEQAVEQVRKDPTSPLTPAAILRELHSVRIKRQQRNARGLGSRVAL